MANRDENGQFMGKAKSHDADDKTLTESVFRSNPDAVRGLRDYIDSDSGIALRMVLRGRRRGLVKLTHVKPDEAAAQLAKVQAFEELVELIMERLPTALEAPPPPASKKGGAQPRTNPAIMP